MFFIITGGGVIKKIVSIIAISFLPILNFYAQEELLSKEFKEIQEYRETAAKQKEALMKQFLAEPIALSADKEGYDVKYYSIDIEINPTTHIITGSVLVHAEVVSDSLILIDIDLMNNMNVDTIKQGSLVLPFTHTQNIITIELPQTYYLNDVFDVLIKYSGTPSSTGGFTGTPFSFTSYGGQPLIYSTVTSARYWWPCKDFPVFPFEGFPYDKADSIDINISVPSNLIVVSNGKLANVLVSVQIKYIIGKKGMLFCLWQCFCLFILILNFQTGLCTLILILCNLNSIFLVTRLISFLLIFQRRRIC